jgi:hypothetical protein
MGVKFICDANEGNISIQNAILGIYLHNTGVGVYTQLDIHHSTKIFKVKKIIATFTVVFVQFLLKQV